MILQSYINQIEKHAKAVKHLPDNQFNNDAKTEQLERWVGHMKQYQRINGIWCANEKSAEDCLQK